MRHLWDGRVLIGRNFRLPLFPVGRPQLYEVDLPPGLPLAEGRDHKIPSLARQQVLELAYEAGEVDGWALLADADCVALRNLDHLFGGGKDLLVSRISGEIDPGFVAVRGHHLKEFVSDVRDSGLNAVLAGGRWKWAEFEKGEVLHAGDTKWSIDDLARAAVVHMGGLEPTIKRRMAFAFHMMAVYDDDTGRFLDFMEA